MTPPNIIYRLEGDRSDVVIVKDTGTQKYHVAYQYSKTKDQWHFVLDKDLYRYETLVRKNAMGVAKRRYNQLNKVV